MPEIPSPSSEFSTPVQETLTKAQEAVLKRVIEILEKDPELNKEVSKAFKQNFMDIVSDKEKFNLLLEKIGESEMQELWKIQNQFEAGEITSEQAKGESRQVIIKYTTIKLLPLKSSIQTAQR